MINKIKADLEWVIKETEDFLKQEGISPNNIIYHKGMLKGYQNTLNEINELLKQS
jgi:hypothetical protein